MRQINLQALLNSDPILHIVRLLLFVVLILSSIEDAKAKQIHVKKVFITIVVMTIMMFFRSDIQLTNCLMGFAFGGIFIIISKCTRGQIGLGDAYIICATGLGLGLLRNLEMLLYAFFFAAIYAMVLILKFHNRKQKLPFVPFLLLGYLCGIYFGGYSL